MEYGAAVTVQDFGSVFSVCDEGKIAIFAPDDTPKSVWFKCPCGCGSHCHCPLTPEQPGGPSWQLSVDAEGKVTLSPSVRFLTGCRAHFFIRDSRAEMCSDSGKGGI